jgi:hypothetical protein
MAYGAPSAPPLASAAPQPGWRRWGTAGVAALVIAAGAAGGGIFIGRTTASTATTTLTATPQPKAFDDADVAWCTEYSATSRRLADAGKAAGAPRELAGKDLPATEWTSGESLANQRFADYSDTWIPGLDRLRDSSPNPILTLLIRGSNQAERALAEKIRTSTYVPGDYSLYRTVTATSNAILAICDRL